MIISVTAEPSRWHTTALDPPSHSPDAAPPWALAPHLRPERAAPGGVVLRDAAVGTGLPDGARDRLRSCHETSGLFTVLVLLGRSWGTGAGVALGAASLITQFMFIPFYPLWSISVMTLDLVAVWALTRSIAVDD
ncbi:DUF7144 family membrane protein [Streptomyces flavalbus]|uniref:DUF7144 domain-containing protein n=1 Tax=Streptomyces flavalbus TaxID=2665155 RepID=A0ABW2W234_9ACTN